jgi:hypothetical protein
MNHGTPHPSDETLLRAIDDELPPGLGAVLDAHLASCEGCRIRRQAIRSSADAASAVCRDDATASPPALEELRARVRASLLQRSAAGDRAWRPHLAGRIANAPAGALAAAALVTIVFCLLVVRYAVEGRAPIGAPATVEDGALPIAALTPGATARVSADDLCAGRGPSNEAVAPAVRLAVLRDYGMEDLPAADYELDHLITPELGGSSDRRNLWPERYGSRVWNARVKDELEQLLPSLVCRGAVDLTTAQRDIAADWIAAYKKYFHTDRPVMTQARAVQRQ